jgi:hypothetical protein
MMCAWRKFGKLGGKLKASWAVIFFSFSFGAVIQIYVGHNLEKARKATHSLQVIAT